jgi:uncharacterized protein YndB with AHSA1/START domain
MEVCPTEVVLAPAEHIWHLFTDPRKLAQWTGLELVEGPACPMSAGDHLVLGSFGLRIAFDVLDTRPPREFTLDVRLPLWDHQPRTHSDHADRRAFQPCDIQLTFHLPARLARGQLVETILGWRFVTGPARSLRRLKRAAEQDPILD